MFAQLGNIRFNLITYFNSFEATQRHSFAEHQTIESKPKLQFIGDELDEINIRLNFHISFCNPELELKKLKDTAKKHEELAFILGNGEYLGKFVILEIISTTQQSDKLANVISIESEIKLKEWSENSVVPKKKQQKQNIKMKQTAKPANKPSKTPKQIVRQG